MIVLADADIERAANAAVHYSMQNAGQTCISVERVYVEAPIYDEFVAQVTEKVRGLRQGVPGRVRHDRRRRDHVPAAARHHRAPRRGRARQGRDDRGRRPRAPRRWPVLRADRPDRRRSHDGLHAGGDVRADAADHEGRRRRRGGAAGQRLRSTGSAASVWGGDTQRAEAVARRIEAGAVTVNDAQINYVATELPMGGWKTSGVGAPPRGRRHPQVLPPAVRARDAVRADEEGPAHAALQGGHQPDDPAHHPQALRARQARLRARAPSGARHGASRGRPRAGPASRFLARRRVKRRPGLVR